MEKDFDGWNKIKKETNEKVLPEEFFFYEREIWWSCLGVNIGREQDGQGDDFERPIIILKVLSPDTLIAVPLSTKKRIARFQVTITFGNLINYGLLDQIRVIDSKRLLRKIGMVKNSEFEETKHRLTGLIKNERPA